MGGRGKAGSDREDVVVGVRVERPVLTAMEHSQRPRRCVRGRQGETEGIAESAGTRRPSQMRRQIIRTECRRRRRRKTHCHCTGEPTPGDFMLSLSPLVRTPRPLPKNCKHTDNALSQTRCHPIYPPGQFAPPHLATGTTQAHLLDHPRDDRVVDHPHVERVVEARVLDPPELRVLGAVPSR